MALPPVRAAAPVSEEMEDVPVAAEVAPVGDVMADEGGGDWVPFATIMRSPDTGEFLLVDGLLPEDDMPTGDEPTFKGGPELLQALMAKIEGGTAGAEEAFVAEGRPARDEAATAAPMPMA